MKKTLLSDLTLTNRVSGAKTIFPMGTEFTLSFEPALPSRIVCTLPDGNKVRVRAENGKKYFGAPFMKAPSLATLEKWESQGGFCKTITGQRTEPDGHGMDGSPSWLLVMGVI